MSRSTARTTRAVCAVAGLALAAAFGAVALVRRDRPLHAYGSTHAATLDIDAPARVGVPLLDTPGRTAVVVRTSRAASLARRGPDVMGLALRAGGRDLLFASTGTGLLGRYVLHLHRTVDGGPLTTLLPLDSPTGALQLALLPEGQGRWRLAWSRPARPAWTPVGVLVAEAADLPDPGHFDPTGRTPDGLRAPGWVRALRGPAYRTARALVRLPGARP